MIAACAIASIVSACIVHLAVLRLAPSLHLIRPNFKEKSVLASYGVVAFAYMAATTDALAMTGLVRWADAGLYLTVMGAMCTLGLIDDLLGSREVGGFKGHFRKLIFEGKLTTGAAKAMGGGIVGVLAGRTVSGGDPVRWVTAALVIPLAANVLNLVDLRPGRAVAVFFGGLGVTYILALGKMPAPWIIGTVALVALAWGIVDSRGKAMMGDAGSNMLGAALGLTIALGTSLPVQIAAIIAFGAIHWYSEKRSISVLIESNRVLRAIDRRLGVR